MIRTHTCTFTHAHANDGNGEYNPAANVHIRTIPKPSGEVAKYSSSALMLLEQIRCYSSRNSRTRMDSSIIWIRFVGPPYDWYGRMNARKIERLQTICNKSFRIPAGQPLSSQMSRKRIDANPMRVCGNTFRNPLHRICINGGDSHGRRRIPARELVRFSGCWCDGSNNENKLPLARSCFARRVACAACAALVARAQPNRRPLINARVRIAAGDSSQVNQPR